MTFWAIGALIGSVLFLIFIVCALPGIIAGWGLLQFKPWARILTIVLSAINLLNAPVGTIIGIYGLWVMLHPETERLFSAVSPPPMSPAQAA